MIRMGSIFLHQCVPARNRRHAASWCGEQMKFMHMVLVLLLDRRLIVRCIGGWIETNERIMGERPVSSFCSCCFFLRILQILPGPFSWRKRTESFILFFKVSTCRLSYFGSCFSAVICFASFSRVQMSCRRLEMFCFVLRFIRESKVRLGLHSGPQNMYFFIL